MSKKELYIFICHMPYQYILRHFLYKIDSFELIDSFCRAGLEAREYIRTKLLPMKKEELKKNPDKQDPVSRMLRTTLVAVSTICIVLINLWYGALLLLVSSLILSLPLPSIYFS